MKQPKMIESRYSIEYIDPNFEKPTSRLGRFLIFTILTISILTAAVMLTYVFLPTNTTQMISYNIEKLVSSFNQDPLRFPIKRTSVSDTNPPHSTTENKIQNQQSIIQLENKYKKEIEQLSQENENKQNDIVLQLSINQNLTKKLEQLSGQLEEKTHKNVLLEKEVMALQSENEVITAQLKIHTKIANNPSEEVINIEPKEDTHIGKLSNSMEVQAPIEKPLPTKENKLVVEEKMTDVNEIKSSPNTSPSIERKPAISPIDAIVATMEAAKNTPKTQEATATSSSQE